jgi:hypothetical protein
MKRVVNALYGLRGYPNTTRFAEFKTDLFANGATPAITMDTAVTNGYSVTGVTTTAYRVAANTTNAFNVASGTVTNVINIAAAASMTNLIKLNALSGCAGVTDVIPKEVPSGGGLGADGWLKIMVNTTPYYIPIFDTKA